MYSKNSDHHFDDRASIEHVGRGQWNNVRGQSPIQGPYNLRDLFFPVSSRPLYWEFENFYYLNLKECERHFAIVDEERKTVFSTVTDGYVLVTNEEAYYKGCKLAESIFSPQRDEGVECIHPYLSPNRATCEIDIARRIQVGQPLIAEDWIPFIRVINSYNKTKALEFNMGFYNQIDNVRMMSNSPLKITHNIFMDKNLFDDWIAKIRKSNEVQREIEAFRKKIDSLRTIKLSKSIILKLYSKYFRVYVSDEMSDQEIKSVISKLKEAETCADEFGSRHGFNAYTLLLVLAKCIEKRESANGLTTDQRKLGKWSDELLESTRSQNFSWHMYIGKDADDTITYYEMNR